MSLRPHAPAISRHEAALLRLVAQRLAGPRAASAVDAAQWLTASQGQDLPGVIGSLALRTSSGQRSEVVAALAAGTLVRSWPMRGTLHVVAAEDLDWILALTRERLLAATVTRRERLGIDASTISAATAVCHERLGQGQAVSRTELFAAWQQAGVTTGRRQGRALLGHLAESSVLALGPLRGTEQLVVLVDAWIRAPRRLRGEEALRELALRYFRSHGPASVADFVWWSKLRMVEARAAVALASGELERVTVADQEMYLDPATPATLAAHGEDASRLLALPGFDEIILGYRDRTITVPPAHVGRLVPGRNGIFRSTIVADGQAVATWRRAARDRGAADTTADGAGGVELAPFAPLRPQLAAAARRCIAAL